MQTIAPTLTPEQILFFHINGFLSVPVPATTPEELEIMRLAYDRIFQERAGRAQGDQFDLGGTDEEGTEENLPQILNPAKYAPELKSGMFLNNLDAIVKQLLGSDASAGVAHAIYKPAGHGAATPWHQDEAYWNPDLQYKSVSIWMPLQEATAENGCLWFMPGSHEWEVLPHQSIGGDVRIHGLEMVDLTPIQNPVCCPLPPGGCTIHRNRTAHYAGPNTSSLPRRALILGAGLAAHPYPGKRSFPWNDIKRTPREERAAAART